MPRIRPANANATQWRPDPTKSDRTEVRVVDSEFGLDVFGPNEQRKRLTKEVFWALQRTVEKGETLDPGIADSVAHAMKDWALENGATHYTHWFQPLTNSTAEKHDSFFDPVGDGTALARFSGQQLVKGEPDASSFPTGGLRATFEARGYTAWDPTSPAFLSRNPNGVTLCIPTAFMSWTGEALDQKVPLIRSMEAINRSATKAMEVLGGVPGERIYTTMGPEQEYFLVDKTFFYQRPDLVTCGRTLFGAKPPKGHELDDHYFGTIPERVLAFMMDTERQLTRLGVPIKTRHNEVAPGQYEIAPVFESTNLSCDHQQLLMTVLKREAPKYGLVCLMHEKPFRGVNGSGKHNNWSMCTSLGENLLDPGDNPPENLRFLFFTAAVIRAVDKHQGLLRATVASAGQDHRLGAAEAPPAIISIFLGTELERILQGFAEGHISVSSKGEFMGLGSPVLPELPKDSADRNRTSPLAFTGNKFEFRALGASQSPSFANTVLNTIVAESIDALREDVEAVLGGEVDPDDTKVDEATAQVVAKTYRKHGRIVFGGDGYSEEWHREAERRGLKNLRTTPDALPEMVAESTLATFDNYGVLSERELHARYEVALEQYIAHVNIEAETAADIARTMLLPAALRYLDLIDESRIEILMEELKPPVEDFIHAIRKLVEVNEVHPEDTMEEVLYMRDTVLPAMNDVRRHADSLERIVADDLWPLPKYSEMLFIR